MGWMVYTSADSVRRRIAQIVLLSCGVATIVAVGTLIDRWGYGRWTIVPWNYFHKDVVEGRPNLDATDPVWAYLTKLVANPMAPLTILWMLAMLVTWIRFPRSVVTWTTLPFFAVHSLVPHKELRYLFPLTLIATFAFVLAFVPDADSLPRPAWLATMWRHRAGWGKALVAVNLVGLLYACFIAREPSLNFQRYLINHYPQGCTMYVLGDQTRSPFENVGATMFFYRPPNFTCRRLHSEDELAAIMRSRSGEVLVVRDRLATWSPPETAADVRLLYSTYPAWVESYNVGNWLSNSKRFSLYAVDTTHVTATGSAEPESAIARVPTAEGAANEASRTH